MFRFTIRELVLLTLVVAMAVGWGVDHWRMATALQDSRHDAREIWYRLQKLESSIWG